MGGVPQMAMVPVPEADPQHQAPAHRPEHHVECRGAEHGPVASVMAQETKLHAPEGDQHRGQPRQHRYSACDRDAERQESEPIHALAQVITVGRLQESRATDLSTEVQKRAIRIRYARAGCSRRSCTCLGYHLPFATTATRSNESEAQAPLQ